MQSRLRVRLVWLHYHYRPMWTLQLASDVDADLARADRRRSFVCLPNDARGWDLP